MATSPNDAFSWMWPWARLAPDKLAQDILTGWSLVSITENNSSAPDTERRIVAQESYGRQIGKLMEAVCALIAERPDDAPKLAAFTELAELQTSIQALKTQAANDRLTRIRDDLALLKANDRNAFEDQAAALRALLGQTN